MPRYSLESLNPRLPDATAKVISAASRGPIARAAAKTFVAGEDVDDAIRVTGDLLEQGRRVSWAPLLRPAGSPDDIITNRAEVIGALNWLSAAGTPEPDMTLDVGIFGVLAHDITPGILLTSMREVGQAARNFGVSLTLTISDASLVEAVYVLGDELRQDFPEVGIVLPTRLRRAPGDLSALARPGRRVRLTTARLDAAVGLTSARDSGNSFVDIAKSLLDGDAQVGFDVDDALLLDIAVSLAQRHEPPAEIVVPLGAKIPRENERAATNGADASSADPEGDAAGPNLTTRIVVPYGPQWQPYVASLMASRPGLALNTPLRPLRRKS